jgi:hypothetical protein
MVGLEYVWGSFVTNSCQCFTIAVQAGWLAFASIASEGLE